MKTAHDYYLEQYTKSCVDPPTPDQWAALIVRLMDCYNWVVTHPKRKAKFMKYIKEKEND